MGGKKDNTELRDKVYDLCDRLGFWNVHPLPVSKQLGTAHQNVSRWKKAWIKKFGLPDVERFGLEMNVNSQSILKELMVLLKDEDKLVRLRAANAFFSGQEKFTAFLESFGYKAKVADKTDISLFGDVGGIKVCFEEASEKRTGESEEKTDGDDET